MAEQILGANIPDQTPCMNCSLPKWKHDGANPPIQCRGFLTREQWHAQHIVTDDS